MPPASAPRSSSRRWAVTACPISAGRWSSATPAGCAAPPGSRASTSTCDPSRRRPPRRSRAAAIDCVDLPLVPEDLAFGELSAVAGDAAFRFIERAVALALSGRGRCHLHRAGQQGGAARRRASLPGTHRDPRAPDRDAGGVDDALHAGAARHSLHDARRTDRRDRAHRRRARRADDPARPRRPRRLGHGRAAHRRLRHQPARGGGRAVRRRRGSAEDRARCRRGAVVAASTLRDRCRPTRFSIEPCAATSIWWWRCTTTRDTARSRCSGSRPA